jgi:heme iron utilization protein
MTTTVSTPVKDPHRDGGFDPQPGIPRITHAELARTLVHLGGRATLSTLAMDPTGYPFGSLVTYLADPTGNPWVLISTMAEHTRNAVSDPRAALLVSEDAPAGIDPLALARVSLIGDLERADPPSSFRDAFVQRHPGSRSYIDFPDFQWWTLHINAVRYVGGFGRMSWVEALAYGDALPDPIAEHANSIVTHMNADHANAHPELLRHFLQRPDITSAQMTSVDRLGCDFDTRSPSGNLPLRLPFTKPALTPTTVRTTIVAMLHQARSGQSTDTQSTDWSPEAMPVTRQCRRDGCSASCTAELEPLEPLEPLDALESPSL